MKNLLINLKKQQISFIFLLIIFIFGLISGIFFYLKQDNIIKENIITSLNLLFKENVFPLKNILFHLLILISITATCFCLLGLPSFIIYLFFESISIGFIIPIFMNLYKINGLLYFLLYFVLIKMIYLILLGILFLKIKYFTKKYLESFKYKKNLFNKEIKYLLVIILFIMINDLIVYFGSNQILTILLG